VQVGHGGAVSVGWRPTTGTSSPRGHRSRILEPPLGDTDREGIIRNPARSGAAIDLLALTNDAKVEPRPLERGTGGEAGVDVRRAVSLGLVDERTMDVARKRTLPLELSEYSVNLLRLTVN
jgi:hypothetical protein